MSLACYCPHCYHKNEYQGVRPTVCENCDKPFATGFKIEKPAKAAHHPRHNHLDVEEADIGEVEDFLSSSSFNIDTGMPHRGTESGRGGVRKSLDLPTIKQVNSALGGAGGEIIQRDRPDLDVGLPVEGRTKSLAAIKSEHMKDLIAPARQAQAAQVQQTAPTPTPKRATKARKRKS